MTWPCLSLRHNKHMPMKTKGLSGYCCVISLLSPCLLEVFTIQLWIRFKLGSFSDLYISVRSPYEAPKSAYERVFGTSTPYLTGKEIL